MSARCCDVICMLLIILLFVGHSPTKSTAVCPVRPPTAESGPQGDCQCSVLDEIQCRGLSGVPEIDLKASYLGRRTFRSLYLARQQIQSLPAAAFAALNVRRIVLDFNPIGDRVSPRAFRGTVDAVDLARLGRVSRRRRTSHQMAGRKNSQVVSSDRQHVNASASSNYTESRQHEVAATDAKQTYAGNRRRHRDLNCNASATYDKTGCAQAEVAVADQSRRYD